MALTPSAGSVSDWFFCRMRALPCPGGEIGRRKGLEGNLSTQSGNAWCEWGQIRGNSSA